MIEKVTIDGLVRDLGLDAALELFELWCTNSPVRLDAAGSALDEGDAAQLARIAHTLKSASAVVGAAGSAQLCAEIERSARQGELDLVRLGLHALSEEFARESRDLAAYLAASAP
jgi:HPt (histidine-containing phosphotransfer) domain-containing protein